MAVQILPESSATFFFETLKRCLHLKLALLLRVMSLCPLLPGEPGGAGTAPTADRRLHTEPRAEETAR